MTTRSAPSRPSTRLKPWTNSRLPGQMLASPVIDRQGHVYVGVCQAQRGQQPRGVLVYSTCSLEPEENERVVGIFQSAHPHFAVEATRSLFPPRDGVDGAFVARFQRTNAA